MATIRVVNFLCQLWWILPLALVSETIGGREKRQVCMFCMPARRVIHGWGAKHNAVSFFGGEGRGTAKSLFLVYGEAIGQKAKTEPLGKQSTKRNLEHKALGFRSV